MQEKMLNLALVATVIQIVLYMKWWIWQTIFETFGNYFLCQKRVENFVVRMSVKSFWTNYVKHYNYSLHTHGAE